MKLRNHNKQQSAFTLIEMVGVLAIIAILAALLVPKIFAAINESRINNAVASFNSVKAATMSYFGKYGRFAGQGGVEIGQNNSGYGTAVSAGNPALTWDNTVLVTEGYLERSLSLRVGTAADVEVAASEAGSVAPTGANSAYALDGAASTNQASLGQYVIETVILNVPVEDARELNQRIDGAAYSEDSYFTNAQNVVFSGDVKGRVKYETTNGSMANVRIYIAHK